MMGRRSFCRLRSILRSIRKSLGVKSSRRTGEVVSICDALSALLGFLGALGARFLGAGFSASGSLRLHAQAVQASLLTRYLLLGCTAGA
jgi:hypothetical protein